MTAESQKLQKIPEWHDVDDAVFKNEIIAQYRPAVLRGFVRKWPVVRHGLNSPEAVCRYLHGFDNGNHVDAIMTPPEVKGRIFYQGDMNGFNFMRNRLPVSAVLDQLLRYAQFPEPPSVAVQSARIADCMPGFLDENKLTALDPSILPRIWIGNKVTVPAHIDEAHNIACSVSGRRRFTLFPPEQVANLYIGPLDYAPTGAPISMVSLNQPDFQRYPKFKEALAAAQVAELEPGDAIYIPTLWWHHVESLGKINILINYWWGGSIGSADQPHSPFDALFHALLNMRGLPPEIRSAWGAMFNHFAFDADADPTAHIPAHRHGVLGDLPPESAAQLRKWLASKLQP
ncbi:cupin-like domain-containing protein [Collimonas sp. NPDC087041]|uniref:cupin-like domain-containing protein n=1 Tax=Collimonas sp. NPDC087041 TaxID=3363960 RepID=UPI0038026776